MAHNLKAKHFSKKEKHELFKELLHIHINGNDSKINHFGKKIKLHKLIKSKLKQTLRMQEVKNAEQSGSFYLLSLIENLPFPTKCIRVMAFKEKLSFLPATP
ncbi:UNVERIFIED_CONTAM: hypothetical protein K2H54_042945 [Gekko kuhli]